VPNAFELRVNPLRLPSLGVSAEPAIEVVDLVKRYPKSPVNAVDGVSFSWRASCSARS
jgi:hypothetical protein